MRQVGPNPKWAYHNGALGLMATQGIRVLDWVLEAGEAPRRRLTRHTLRRAPADCTDDLNNVKTPFLPVFHRTPLNQSLSQWTFTLSKIRRCLSVYEMTGYEDTQGDLLSFGSVMLFSIVY